MCYTVRLVGMWWNGGDSATSNYKFGSLEKSYEEKNETKFFLYRN